MVSISSKSSRAADSGLCDAQTMPAMIRVLYGIAIGVLLMILVGLSSGDDELKTTVRSPNIRTSNTNKYSPSATVPSSQESFPSDQTIYAIQDTLLDIDTAATNHDYHRNDSEEEESSDSEDVDGETDAPTDMDTSADTDSTDNASSEEEEDEDDDEEEDEDEDDDGSESKDIDDKDPFTAGDNPSDQDVDTSSDKDEDEDDSPDDLLARGQAPDTKKETDENAGHSLDATSSSSSVDTNIVASNEEDEEEDLNVDDEGNDEPTDSIDGEDTPKAMDEVDEV